VNNVGKALSLEHANRMIEHADINTVMNKQSRLRAVGTEADFPEDPMAIYMTRFCEEIFAEAHPIKWRLAEELPRA